MFKIVENVDVTGLYSFITSTPYIIKFISAYSRKLMRYRKVSPSRWLNNYFGTLLQSIKLIIIILVLVLELYIKFVFFIKITE